MHTKPALLMLFAVVTQAADHFYPDDPLDREPKPVSFPAVKNRKLSDYYDLLRNQFATPGERQPETGPRIRARAVNTLGEPMQGAWWEKRHYYRRMTIEELKRGAGSTLPKSGSWLVVSAKTEGVTPGFVILDEAKRRFFIKFDPLSNPEMATSADAISSRLFYAMGYHTPENSVVYFRRDQLAIGEDVTVTDSRGRPRKMSARDMSELLQKVPQTKDGRYRATASFALPGKPIGPPRYNGTRTDDPNDTVPHEHRRDQRALHVIDAWLDHDDSRAINNFDAIVKDGDVSYVKHFQLDFGSTLGSGTQQANSPRSGSYYFTWKGTAKQLFTLGLDPPYWAFAHYPNYPSIGRFEWKVFDPERWLPDYPNPAFLNRLPDDEFWGAKLVTAFTDEEIRAIVRTGELSDSKAEAYLVECLAKRRDKVGKTYFSKVLPFDKFQVANGKLTWDDLGARLGYVPSSDVTISWETFNNQNGKCDRIPGAISAEVPSVASGFTRATLTSKTDPRQKIEVFSRHKDGAVDVVGLERYW